MKKAKDVWTGSNRDARCSICSARDGIQMLPLFTPELRSHSFLEEPTPLSRRSILAHLRLSDVLESGVPILWSRRVKVPPRFPALLSSGLVCLPLLTFATSNDRTGSTANISLQSLADASGYRLIFPHNGAPETFNMGFPSHVVDHLTFSNVLLDTTEYWTDRKWRRDV